MRRLVVGVVLGLALHGACGAAVLSNDRRAASAFLKSGDFIAATLAVGFNLRGPKGGQDAAAIRLLRSKAYSPGLLAQVSAIEGADVTTYANAAQALTLARAAGLVDEVGAVAAAEALKARYQSRVVSGSVSGTVWDEPFLWQNSSNPAFRSQILKASIRRAANDGLAQHEYDLLAEFVRGDADLKSELGRSLPSLRIPLELLKGRIAGDYPDIARSEAERRVAALDLAGVGDQFFGLDLSDALSGRNEFSIVGPGAPSRVAITVRQLGLVISPRPSETRTVSYADTQVDVMKAAFLMPRNASYHFDLATGGVDYEYAFEVTVQRDGRSDVRLLRDRGSKEWSNCTGARVTNVFGGSQPVQWFANREMEAMCGGPNRAATPTTAMDVRRDIAEELANRIVEAVGPF